MEVQQYITKGKETAEKFIGFYGAFTDSILNSGKPDEALNPTVAVIIREVAKETFLMNYQAELDREGDVVLLNAGEEAEDAKCGLCQCSECEHLEDCEIPVKKGEIPEELAMLYPDIPIPCRVCDITDLQNGYISKQRQKANLGCGGFCPRRK